MSVQSDLVIKPETEIVAWLRDLKHRVFPRPFERLGLAGKMALVGIEIGVYRGDHALSLLQSLDIAKLYLVDPYVAYAESSLLSTDLDSAKIMAQERINRIYANKVEWVFENSKLAASMIPNAVDFVYVDAAHDFESVSNDIISYWPKIKVGGVLGGHDFYNGHCNLHDGVVEAVIAFSTARRLPLKVELPDWWIVKME